MTASSSVPRHRADQRVRMSPDALDRLRGLLLAERDARCAELAEHEASLLGASPDAFGVEVRRLAELSIARNQGAINDVDRTLERLVQEYQSCEWCETVIPPECLDSVPAKRLCERCKQPLLRSRSARGSTAVKGILGADRRIACANSAAR